jgi:predicted translin family RNA/ssDNA-binding protein
VVTGVRRKLDVDRLLVESTRAMVAEELRRSALLKALDQLGVDRKRQS